MPGHRLFLFGLAQALEQRRHATAVSIQRINIVNDDKLVAMPVELGVHAEGGWRSSRSNRPCRRAPPHKPALGQPSGAYKVQEMNIPTEYVAGTAESRGCHSTPESPPRAER